MGLSYFSILVQLCDLKDILDFVTCLPEPAVRTHPSLLSLTLIFLSYVTSQLPACPFALVHSLAWPPCLPGLFAGPASS